MNENLQPIYRNDHELMGFIQLVENDIWIPLTVFKIPFGKSMDKNSAIAYVLDKGLQILSEKWEYFNNETKTWNLCIILEANPDSVRIQEGIYSNSEEKSLTLQNPSEDNFRLYQ